MKVQLVRHTENPDRAVAEAAWICYHENWDGVDEMSDEDVAAFVKRLGKMGHTSTYEHAVFTFRISGVSRALTHQLVRHRIASYSQQSQRYVVFDKDVKIEFVYPESVLMNEAAGEVYECAMAYAEEAYSKLVELGIPAEDARYVLPNATPSEIVITINARSLLNFFKERCCTRAQWEIREMASRMLCSVNKKAPALFAYAGPECVTGTCKQGKMSCGNPWSKR